MSKNNKLKILFGKRLDEEIEKEERKGGLKFFKMLLIILAGLLLGVTVMLLFLSRNFATSFLGGFLGSLMPSIFLMNYYRKNNNI